MRYRVGWSSALRCALVWGVAAVAGCGGRSLENDTRPGASSAGASDAAAGSAALAAGASSAGDIGSTGTAGDRTQPSTDDTPASDAPQIELVSNLPPLGVFVGKLGIYLVFADEVRLFDHGGKLLLTRALDASARGAAFDEERLTTLSNDWVITTYDAEVQRLGTFTAPACGILVGVSKRRIVCTAYFGGFTVFDGNSGAELQGPDHQAFPGEHFLRVPGSDDFIFGSAVTQQSNYALYRLTPDNHVLLLEEASTQRRVGWDGAFGFDGSTPPALISESGERLGLNPDCSATAPRASSPCFLSDNPLNAIAPGRSLAAIAPGPAAHEFFGLVGTPDPSGINACHIGGCDIELIDTLDGRVRRQRHIDPHSSNINAFLWDAQAHAIVLGWARVADNPVDYRAGVVLIPF